MMIMNFTLRVHLVIILYVLCWWCGASHAHRVSLNSLDLFVDRSLLGYYRFLGNRIGKESYYRGVVQIVVEQGGMSKWELRLQLPSAQDRIVEQDGKHEVSNGAQVIGYLGDTNFRKSYYNSSESIDGKSTENWEYVLGPMNWTKKVHEGGHLFIEFIATNKNRLSAEEIRKRLQMKLTSKAEAPVQFEL